MKKTLLYSLILFICFFYKTLSAQVSLIASNANGGPYTTLKEAFDSINTGAFTGNITIDISGNTVENASAILNGSGVGAATYSAINISPSGGIPRTITGFVIGPLISFNGADSVTIDGVDTAGNALTITNLSTSGASTVSTIRFYNDASANAIRNCTLLGSGTSTGSGTILFSTGNITGNDNDSILNCTIDAAGGNYPTFGIYCIGSGTPGRENSADVISNCNIANYYHTSTLNSGINITNGGTAWVINENRFYQSSVRNYSAAISLSAIRITTGSGYSITANKIGHSSSADTGIYTISSASLVVFNPIYLSVGATVPTSVQGNIISDISFTTGGIFSSVITWAFYGINISAGSVNMGNIQGNTIGSQTATASITIATNTFGAEMGAAAIYIAGGNSYNISNNAIGGIECSNDFADEASLYGLYTSGTPFSLIVHNNTFGSSVTRNMISGGYATFGSHAAGVYLASGAISADISGNTIQNFFSPGSVTDSYMFGVYVKGTTTTINVSNNTIFGLIGESSVNTFQLELAAAGIAIERGTNVTISNNVISGIVMSNFDNSSNTPGTAGIGVAYATNLLIEKNRISGITNTSNDPSVTSPANTTGIKVRNGNAGGIFRVINNMISIGNKATSHAAVIGIWIDQDNTNSYSVKCYHNTVKISDTTIGANPSFCFYRGNFSSTASSTPVSIKNNIFINERTGGSGVNFAIANNYAATASTATGWVSNHNLLSASNTSTVGYWSGNWDFATWKIVSASDTASVSGIAVNFADAASADMHLTSTSVGDQNLGGTGLSDVPADYDNDIRDAFRPYIGADEAITILPLRFISFTANRHITGNLLSWKVACSNSSLKFVIERSGDGKSFSQIDKITLTGGQCTNGTTYTDKEPLAGSNYYRLKMITQENSFMYSEVRMVTINAGYSINIYPNPVKNSLHVDIESQRKTNVQVQVITTNGKVLISDKFILPNGVSGHNLNVSHLQVGTYMLKMVSNDNQMQIVRFEKL